MLQFTCRDFQLELWSVKANISLFYIALVWNVQFSGESNGIQHPASPVQVYMHLPYTLLLYTFSHVSIIHVLLHMFLLVSDRSCNYKGVKLPSGCVVPRSRSIHTFGCCFVNCRGGGGAEEVHHFRLPGPPGLSTIPGWYKVCQIGKSEQQVHLQPLCCIWSCRFECRPCFHSHVGIF